MTKVSIIIPYYKTYEETIKLLDILIPQLTNETEVFLIDDGCKEERLDIFKDKIIAANKEVNWYPDYVGEKRFANWLENLQD